MIRWLIDFSLDNRLAVVALWVLLTAIGCFVALLVSGCHFMAVKTEGAALFDALSTLTPETFREIFAATFDPMDGVFYGIALVVGFRVAYRY